MAGLVYGCVVPHPPIMVPDVGGGREKEVSKSIEAMGYIARELEEHRPDVILIISPHGIYFRDAMGILTASSSQGTLNKWGAQDVNYSFDNDLDVVPLIQEEAQTANIPLQSMAKEQYDLDHGVMVPAYFLIDVIRDLPLVPLSFSWLPLKTHFQFGEAIKRALERLNKRVALIASGDLSHRLMPDAPAGYDPIGKVFDEKVTQALASSDAQALLDLDQAMIERAGECGLRSITILMGALKGLPVVPRLLSYEGPFGVGYPVASFAIREKEPTIEPHPLVRLARQSVETYVREGKVIAPKNLTPEMMQRAGAFVSIKKEGNLRGCVGTFGPTKANIAEEVVANAIGSATSDFRFPQITAKELSQLTYTVDVLGEMERVKDIQQLDPKRYGLVVERGDRKGVLLPDLEAVQTVEQQLSMCRIKAAIDPDEPVTMYRFQVKRYPDY